MAFAKVGAANNLWTWVNELITVCINWKEMSYYILKTQLYKKYFINGFKVHQ